MPIDSWNNAPPVLAEWTGRDDLLGRITDDWIDSKKRVTGLIGFGGEGKSSLARKWVDNLLQDASKRQTEGVFWWGFYENRSVDEFLEAAINYLSGGNILPRAVTSSSQRAQIIGAMLTAGCYLFVLDGVEVIQYQDGDQYGLTESKDFRDVISFFAHPNSQSFCLITSRVPILDLIDYTTYTHRDVDRLLPADGRTLLQRLGVKGSEAELDEVVADWDGHALTLSLLGSYLTEHCSGEISHIAEIPRPTAEEPRYERVHRVLRRYDEHLSDAEREFLGLFSTFRTPVHEAAFERIFLPSLRKTRPTTNVSPVSRLRKSINSVARIFHSASNSPVPDSEFTISSIRNIVDRLLSYRILRHDHTLQTYTTHPLIHNHYSGLFNEGDAKQRRAVHSRIKSYYLNIARQSPENPTLDDLKPLIEAVHHTCQAGAYEDAFEIYSREIERGPSRNILTYNLGSFETEFNLLQEFFTNGDTAQEPLVYSHASKRFILNKVGFCLMSLGRLRQALQFYERVYAMDHPSADHAAGLIKSSMGFDLQTGRGTVSDSSIGESIEFYFPPRSSSQVAENAAQQALVQKRREKLRIASATLRNLAELYVQLGNLVASADAAREALNLAGGAENKQDECYSLARLAWAQHLQGDVVHARHNFGKAEQKKIETEPSRKYLYSDLGIFHADHLHRVGENNYARHITEANLRICEREHWVSQSSWCHRVLGDLDTDSGDLNSANEHYEAAFKNARSVQRRDVLIEALLARGKYSAKFRKDPDTAFADLSEALTSAIDAGYGIYEADIRIALAWAHIANNEKEKAKTEAERAMQISSKMRYYWGKVDGEEVLRLIEART